ncbi:hypothetical protein [Novosphingobium sp. TH158]|uniref:hypothetical protein n=1 Tax=Novosphingobium sp. TH158 TaxID=2067455 RepID=UPI000C7ABA7B|nr:hypothetical protein [Novosphingobium sp. TH158]PLK26266.1 hypothetical protein C0V78_04730 [Novosphingobium sp. TH158]
MKRIILAFLALLGLVAQTAPAQARICGIGSEQIGAVAGPRTQAQALAAQALPGVAAQVRPERRDRDCSFPQSSRKRPVYIPSVQLRVDRALE